MSADDQPRRWDARDAVKALGHPAFSAGYDAGLTHGVELGRAMAEAEVAEQWAKVARQIRALAQIPDYPSLCERRGEPDRAERARALLAERGIWE